MGCAVITPCYIPMLGPWPFKLETGSSNLRLMQAALHSVWVCMCDCGHVRIQVHADVCVKWDGMYCEDSVVTLEQTRHQLPLTEGMKNIMKNIMKCQSMGFFWLLSTVATCWGPGPSVSKSWKQDRWWQDLMQKGTFGMVIFAVASKRHEC